MADDVNPSDVRARRFDVVRRGYERAQVEAYLEKLATELEQLERKLERRKTKELKVGLDDPEALALELAAIGGEIATILEAARAASDGMRTRAASDVSDWKSSTEEEMHRLTEEATEQSQSMRAAAWNEGSSMLSSASAEARELVDAAQEDALFVRAEAEREAIRHTGDAKRDREELIRTARLESEEVIEAARRESDGMLAAANQQAEQAQERARALEDRRSELLAELESTRDSIVSLDAEIDSRRQALETPEPEPPAERSHHGSDGGSVKIVAPSRSVKLKPVDAEDLVADVVALRSGVSDTAESEQTPTHESEPPAPEPVPAPPTEPEPEPVEPETVTVIAPPPPPPPVATEEEKQESVGSDEIGSLFATLRESTADEEQPRADDLTTEVESSDGGKDDPAPAEPEGESEPEAVLEVAEVPDVETLDATLIPLQNKALKDIKRTLVDLQNDSLEHLRTDEDWIPTKSFMNKFKTPYAELAEAISGSKDDGGAAKEFAGDLHSAVSDAIGKARTSGAGDREVASSVSRVFRMWRADESERRVVDSAQAMSLGS